MQRNRVFWSDRSSYLSSEVPHTSHMRILNTLIDWRLLIQLRYSYIEKMKPKTSLFQRPPPVPPFLSRAKPPIPPIRLSIISPIHKWHFIYPLFLKYLTQSALNPIPSNSYTGLAGITGIETWSLPYWALA